MSTYFVEMRNMERDAALAEPPTWCPKCKETGIDEKKSKGTFAEVREYLCDCDWARPARARINIKEKKQKK